MVDIGAALRRSLALGVVVMVLTVVLSVLAGLAFRKKLTRRQRAVLHHGGQPDHAVDHRVAGHRRCSSGCSTTRHQGRAEALAGPSVLETYGTSLGLFTSALGAHLTWTLPFGLLIMFAVFNRFNPAYEEAARDLGATPWQTLPPCRAAADRAVGGGHRHVRLHAQLGRNRPHLAGDRRRQHAAAGTAGPDLDRDHAVDLRAGHGDHAWCRSGDRRGAVGLAMLLRPNAADEEAPRPHEPSRRCCPQRPPACPRPPARDNDDLRAHDLGHPRPPPAARHQAGARTSWPRAFGVSRTRIRPVLVRLANEQVVTLTPNRGAAIAQPTAQEAREVFEARRLIEPRLVELFIDQRRHGRHRTSSAAASTTKKRPAWPATCAARSGCPATSTCSIAEARGPPDAGPHPARAGLAHLADPHDLQRRRTPASARKPRPAAAANTAR